MSKITVFGAGAWGTALALQSVRAGHRVVLVARDPEAATMIGGKRENPRLPGHSLPDSIDVRSHVPGDSDLLLWAVPTQELRTSLSRLPATGAAIIVCAKGVEAGTHMLPLEVVNEVSPGRRLAVLTGPNFAHEVAAGLPTATVVASVDATLREEVLRTLGSRTFRAYGNSDPVGAQLGGATKNVIAIAAGAVIGAGLGENARAALVTRGLSELRRLAVALGGRAETTMGLSGLGDLLLTCGGPTSRNFSLGHALGRGRRLSEVLAGRSAVIEGVATAAALIARAGNLELPICQTVADFLAELTTLEQAIGLLLGRPQRDE